MIKTEFSFGEEITVTGEIARIKTYKSGSIIPSRFWSRNEHPSRPALFLNGIHLANGTVEIENYGEDGNDIYFNPSELIKGAWICEKNRAPRKVFLSDCHKKEQK